MRVITILQTAGNVEQIVPCLLSAHPNLQSKLLLLKLGSIISTKAVFFLSISKIGSRTELYPHLANGTKEMLTRGRNINYGLPPVNKSIILLMRKVN